MAELTTVARPYAEAVFRSAVEAKDVDGFGAKLKSLGAIAANPQMASLVGNPNVSAAEKATLLASITGEQVQAPLANLLAALIDNGKSALLPYITPACRGQQFSEIPGSWFPAARATRYGRTATPEVTATGHDRYPRKSLALAKYHSLSGNI